MDNFPIQDNTSNRSHSQSDSEDTHSQSSSRELDLSTQDRTYPHPAIFPFVFVPTSLFMYNGSRTYNSSYYDEGPSVYCSNQVSSSPVSSDRSLTPSSEQEEMKNTAASSDSMEAPKTAHDHRDATPADISSRPWDWAQSPEFFPNQSGALEEKSEDQEYSELSDDEGMVSLSRDSEGKLVIKQVQPPVHPTYPKQAPQSYAEAVKSDDMWDVWNCSQALSTQYEQCDMCMEVCLDPTDLAQQREHRQECTARIELEMEEAFAYQRSEGKMCGICYEEVINKQTYSERRFGILLGCLHVFCLSCIRKWRTNSGGDKNAVRSCPLCRTHSDYIIPSAYWVDETEDKAKLIDQYQKKLSHIACRYFDEGNGTCPFGNNCFYMHALPNGKLYREKLRKYGNAEGEITIVKPVRLNQFIQERDNRAFT